MKPRMKKRSDMAERYTGRGKRRFKLFGRVTSDPSSSLSLQPASMLGATTRDSGKDRRRALKFNTNNICVCVGQIEECKYSVTACQCLRSSIILI